MSHANLNTTTKNDSISNTLQIKLPTTGMNLVILSHICILPFPTAFVIASKVSTYCGYLAKSMIPYSLFVLKMIQCGHKTVVRGSVRNN